MALGQSSSGTREPIAVTDKFAFFSDQETNLNDALIAAGVARRFERAELFHGGPGKTCFDQLPPSRQHGWNLAVDYYSKVISAESWDSRQQYLLRLDLAGLRSRESESGQDFLNIAEGFRSAARPAFLACRWKQQDQANRRWIDEVAALLHDYEKTIAARLSELYQQSWIESPVVIDVVETVSWSGANSTFPGPGQAHVLISQSGSSGFAALETVFHEASHGFMLPGRPIPTAFVNAAKELGLKQPTGLWHVVLFHTTGQAVRETLANNGIDGYTPLIEEIYTRSDWVRYRAGIEHFWQPYLNGNQSSAAAVKTLLRDWEKAAESDTVRP